MQGTLAHCGILKFMWIPFMKSLCLLLETLVRFWDVRREFFIVQGHHVEITLWDVYFLTGLPMLGVVGDLVPKFSREETLDELCERNYYGSTYVHGLHILF